MKGQHEPMSGMNLTSEINAGEETVSGEVSIQDDCRTPQFVEPTDNLSDKNRCSFLLATLQPIRNQLAHIFRIKRVICTDS